VLFVADFFPVLKVAGRSRYQRVQRIQRVQGERGNPESRSQNPEIGIVHGEKIEFEFDDEFEFDRDAMSGVKSQ
jgi:hypothetical protein